MNFGIITGVDTSARRFRAAAERVHYSECLVSSRSGNRRNANKKREDDVFHALRRTARTAQPPVRQLEVLLDGRLRVDQALLMRLLHDFMPRMTRPPDRVLLLKTLLDHPRSIAATGVRELRLTIWEALQ